MKKHLAFDREMMGEIYGSGDIEENMEWLCDKLPHRFAGSPEEKKAASYVARTMRAYGLSNVGLESFGFQGWKRGGPSGITVLKTKRELPCIALPYSPATAKKGEVLDLCDLGWCTPEDIATAGKKLRGKAALVRLGQPGGSRRLHRAEKYGRVVEAGAAAFLFANSEPGLLEPTGSARFGRKAEIPAVGIAYENGAYLRRLLRDGKVRVKLTTRGTVGRARSQNVVGEIPGRKKEVVVVGGHLDSHDIAPGASDNASGVATVLEMARAMVAVGVKPLRTIRFVAFGCEEHGLHGSVAYVKAHADELDRIRFMFNVDTVPATHPFGLEFHLWPGVEGFVSQAAAEMSRGLPVTQTLCLHSDHFNFFLAGVPTARLVSEGDPRSVRGWGHTAADTLDKVNYEMFKSAADLTARFLLRVADDPSWPLRRRPLDEVDHLMVGAGWDEILKYET